MPDRATDHNDDSTPMHSLSREAAFTIQPELLARVAKGDKQAFAELYDRSSPLLFTLASRMLGDGQEAGELLREVYLEVWRKGVRYDVGRGAPIAWLVAVTRTRALDRLRSRAVRTGAVGDGQPDFRDHAAPEAALADLELQAFVSKAIAEVPEAQRQAIELAYFDGLSSVDIAAHLSHPVETINDRIRQGVRALKAALRPALDSQSRDDARRV